MRVIYVCRWYFRPSFFCWVMLVASPIFIAYACQTERHSYYQWNRVRKYHRLRQLSHVSIAATAGSNQQQRAEFVGCDWVWNHEFCQGNEGSNIADLGKFKPGSFDVRCCRESCVVVVAAVVVIDESFACFLGQDFLFYFSKIIIRLPI